MHCCIQWFKDTNLKANHNNKKGGYLKIKAVFNGSKILIWKQITTLRGSWLRCPRCIQWFKDTNLKANHNWLAECVTCRQAVFNGSKILIWKQITTPSVPSLPSASCIQWFKDTNLKANHNRPYHFPRSCYAVFNGSKILIWKQITTVHFL